MDVTGSMGAMGGSGIEVLVMGLSVVVGAFALVADVGVTTFNCSARLFELLALSVVSAGNDTAPAPAPGAGTGAGTGASTDADVSTDLEVDPEYDDDSESDAVPRNGVTGSPANMRKLLDLCMVAAKGSEPLRTNLTTATWVQAQANPHRCWKTMEVPFRALVRQDGFDFKFVRALLVVTAVTTRLTSGLRLDVYGPWGLPLDLELPLVAALEFLDALVANFGQVAGPDDAASASAATPPRRKAGAGAGAGAKDPDHLLFAKYLSRPAGWLSLDCNTDPATDTTTDVHARARGSWIAGTLSLKHLELPSRPLSLVFNLNTRIPGTVHPADGPSTSSTHGGKPSPLVLAGIVSSLDKSILATVADMRANLEGLHASPVIAPEDREPVPERPRATAAILHHVVETLLSLTLKGLAVAPNTHIRNLLELCVRPSGVFTAGEFPSLPLARWELPMSNAEDLSGTMRLLPVLTPVRVAGTSHPELRTRGFATHALLTLYGLPFPAPPRFMLRARDVRLFVRLLAHGGNKPTEDTAMRVQLFTPWADDNTSAAAIGFLDIKIRGQAVAAPGSPGAESSAEEDALFLYNPVPVSVPVPGVAQITLVWYAVRSEPLGGLRNLEPVCITATVHPDAHTSMKRNLGWVFKAMGGGDVILPVESGEEFMSEAESRLQAWGPSTPVYSPGKRRGKATGPDYAPLVPLDKEIKRLVEEQRRFEETAGTSDTSATVMGAFDHGTNVASPLRVARKRTPSKV
jgi:hypothetical protein